MKQAHPIHTEKNAPHAAGGQTNTVVGAALGCACCHCETVTVTVGEGGDETAWGGCVFPRLCVFRRRCVGSLTCMCVKTQASVGTGMNTPTPPATTHRRRVWIPRCLGMSHTRMGRSSLGPMCGTHTTPHHTTPHHTTPHHTTPHMSYRANASIHSG